MIGWGKDPEPAISELHQMCSDALKKKNFHKTRELALILRGRTIAEKDTRTLGYADFYLGASEIFLSEPESGLTHLEEARAIAQEIGNDTLLGKALNCLGIYEANVNSNYYLAQHYLIQALDCYDTEGSASTNLAQIAILQNDTSGIIYARRAYEYGIRSKEVHYSYSALHNLVEFSIMKGDFEAASSYLQQAKEIADKYSCEDKEMLKLLEATILTKTGESVKSNELLLEIYPAIESAFPLYLPNLLLLMGENYNEEGRYGESNTILLKAIEAAQNASSFTSLVRIYRLIADNYSLMGLDSQSLIYMRKAFELLEKNAQTDQQRMVNERKLLLEVINQDQQRQQAEEKARYNGRLSISLGLLLVLASAIIVIVILNMRRRNRLYRHIVQQNVAMLDKEEKYQARIKDLESRTEDAPKAIDPPISLPHVTETDDSIPYAEDNVQKFAAAGVMSKEKSKRLFESLQTLMEDEMLFRNPQLTRETVIEMLKTNSTYLAQAIKENSGMNYSQYVNSFRMREALKVLSDRERIEIPIKDIAMESGFNSIATFYKLFQQATGISPAAYRHSLAKIS